VNPCQQSNHGNECGGIKLIVIHGISPFFIATIKCSFGFGSPNAVMISDFVVLFLIIFDCRLCDVSFLDAGCLMLNNQK
jgi:hypothetical protein